MTTTRSGGRDRVVRADAADLAGMARTMLAAADHGTLWTQDCRQSRPQPTLVHLEEPAAGRPLVVLEASSPAVARLRRWPVARLAVADGATVVEVVATLRPVCSERERVAVFRPTVLSVAVRVDGRRHPVGIDDYRAAGPDLGRVRTTVALRHLRRHHGAELAAYVVRHGAVAGLVADVDLDGAGVVLRVLGPHGVTTLTVPHPEVEVGDALHDLDRLAVAHALPLTCVDAHV
ncbi:MAG: hypothetical protein CMH83_04405 [Nocardioides sp.]|nr:hypothetical protein [Nocardioides sp.]